MSQSIGSIDTIVTNIVPCTTIKHDYSFHMIIYILYVGKCILLFM